MSSIFISHSSRDNGIAEELKRRLTEQGYHSVFLDFDPELGIPAGREWEKELYARLRACRAVVVLWSAHSKASRWCFAEFTHARALGKHVFPIRIDPSPLDPLLRSAQAIDATEGWEEAYRALWRGLQSAGLDPREPLAWNPDRPPYPGLLAFQEEDAAVFFGRDAEIRKGLDLLNQLQRFGGPRLVLVLGASGSGKSSVVRAGLLPRLRRDPEGWVVLPAFRPLDRPFAELAKVLSAAFEEVGAPREPDAIRSALLEAATDPDGCARCLMGMASDLRERAGRTRSTVIMTVDQCEELRTNVALEEVRRFLPFLAALLRGTENPLLVLGTLRSEDLGAWQQEPALGGVLFESLPLGPLSEDHISDIITGPAQVAGLDLEPGLVPAMVADAGTPDALPLLAFTLRELWERGGQDGALQLREYREEVGGLAGSVARAAESVLRAHVAATGRGTVAEGQVHLAPEDESALRAAMLAMVRLDGEGRYVRQVASFDELPQATWELLQRFIAARLLVPRGEGRELEVRHEALFRAWDRLGRWLDEAREFLIWRKRLKERLEEWERRSRRDADTLLRGGLLAEAVAWQGRSAVPLNEDEVAFIEESRRTNRARLRRRYVVRASAVLGILAVSTLGYVVVRERARRAQLQSVAILDTAVEADDPLVRALLLAELEGRAEPPDVMAVAQRILGAPFPAAVLRGHAGAVTGAAWSPDGALIATISQDRTARVWRSDGRGDPRVLEGHAGVLLDVAFSSDGERLATASEDGTVRVWRLDAAEEEPLVLSGHAGGVWDLSFDGDGRRIVTASEDGIIRVWSATRRSEPLVLGSTGGAVLCVAFSPDNAWIAAGSEDSLVRLWNAGGPGSPRALPRHGNLVKHVEFNRDGSRLLTISLDGMAQVWSVGPQPAAAPILSLEEPVSRARFSPDGSHLVVGTGDGSVGVWSLDEGAELYALRGLPASVRDVAFSPDGRQVLAALSDGSARLWRPPDSASVTILRGHRGEVQSGTFSPDGIRAVTTSEDGTARVWYVDGRGEPEVFDAGPAQLTAVALDPEATRVAAGDANGTVRIWSLLDHSAPPVTLTGSGGYLWDVRFNPDGTKVVAASGDGRAVVYPMEKKRPPVVFREHRGAVHSAVWSADGSRILTASDDGTARIWNASNGAELAAFAEHGSGVSTATFSPDGSRVLTASADGTARLWNSDGSGVSVVLRGHSAAILDAAFDAAGERVVTASEDTTARVWSAENGSSIAVLRGHTFWVRSASFSPDGGRVLTASEDGTARLWPLDDEGESMLVTQHAAPVSSARFTPGETRVLTVSDDGTVRIQLLDRSQEPVVLGGGEGPIEEAVMSGDGSRVATINAQKGIARVWRVEWGALLEYLRSSTTACLSAEERMWLLNQSRGRAHAEASACERRHGRSSPAARPSPISLHAP